MRRPDLRALLALVLSLFVFYPELCLARAASLMGDHWEQHYPWAFYLAQNIRHFRIPFWTDLIHCGMPIAAESQIGVFYLPNLILYLLLPFRWAYAYMNVLHYLLSGWATYLYARTMKLDRPSAFVAAFIFLYGAGYGGAYYNITSLKTIAWFPLALYFFEKFFQGRKQIYVALISFSIALSLVAG